MHGVFPAVCSGSLDPPRRQAPPVRSRPQPGFREPSIRRTIVRYAYAQIGEDLYVLGGVSDGTRVPDVNKYSATTNSWTPLAPIPVASEAPAAAYLDGKIYLVEGDTGDSFQIYNVATNTWTTGTSRPGYGDNYGAAAGAYNGKVYIVGGWNGQDGTTTTSVYDPATSTWSTGNPAPTAFFLAGYHTVGQYLYIVGGFQPGGPGANINMTMRLDMSNGTWTTGPTWTPRACRPGNREQRKHPLRDRWRHERKQLLRLHHGSRQPRHLGLAQRVLDLGGRSAAEPAPGAGGRLLQHRPRRR